MALACDLELDTLPCCAETHKWAWFRRYCTASRVAVALDKRTSLPRPFLDEVRARPSCCHTLHQLWILWAVAPGDQRRFSWVIFVLLTCCPGCR